MREPEGLERGRVLLAIVRAGTNIHEFLERRLAHHGLSPGEFEVLRALALHEGCSMAQLARVVGLTRQGVRTLLEQLVLAGLVEAKRSATDRRRFDLTLTALGRLVLGGALTLVGNAERRFLSGLDESVRLDEWLRTRVIELRADPSPLDFFEGARAAGREIGSTPYDFENPPPTAWS